VTPLDELRGGSIGEEFVSLLRKTIRAVAVTRNFPPPEDLTKWDSEAVGRIVSEFVADPQTPRRLMDLATTCSSDQALKARVESMVRNFLADLGRRTPIGKLVVRLNDVLGKSDQFVRVDGRWALVDGPAGPGLADLDRLAEAIRRHEIMMPKWGHDARREAPVADAGTIASLCKALLKAAGGSLTSRIMASAIGVRLGLGQAPVSLDASSLDGAWSPVSSTVDATADEALREARATEVLALLNDRERLALAWLECPVRELAPLLGVGPSQAHVIRKGATELLRIELVDDSDGEAIAAHVLELARLWTEQWTDSGVPT
jgi:hypothetical protein